MSAEAARIAEITEVSHGGLNPLHDVTDRAKVASLAADMAERGWQGPPLVVDGENALTGTHRIAAVRALRNTEGIRVAVPRVEIADLCAAYGLDWAALRDQHDGDSYWAAAALRDVLPPETVDYLGFDVDGPR